MTMGFEYLITAMYIAWNTSETDSRVHFINCGYFRE